jgi:hypothetical protein
MAYGFTEWFTAVLDWPPGVAGAGLTAIDIGNDGDGAAGIALALPLNWGASM